MFLLFYENECKLSAEKRIEVKVRDYKVSDIITVPRHIKLVLKEPLQEKETTLVQYASVTPIKRSRINLYRLDNSSYMVDCTNTWKREIELRYNGASME